MKTNSSKSKQRDKAKAKKVNAKKVKSDKRLLTDDCRPQLVDERWAIALGSSCLMVWRPSVPFAPPLRACGSTGVLLAVGRRAFAAFENLALI